MKWQHYDWDIFMPNIQKLEKKWYQYRVKKFLTRFLFILSFFALGLSLYYTLTQVKGEKKVENNTSNEMKKVVLQERNVTISEIPVVQTDTSSVVTKNDNFDAKQEVSLEPIIPVIDMAKEERKSANYAKGATTKSTLSNGIRAKPSTYLTAQELATVEETMAPHKPVKMQFQSSSNNYTETIKSKFLNSKNPRDALLLAKAYYNEGKYKEAEKWALTANKLDQNLEDSWFVFAKAKAKLGKNQEAINILSTYYQRTKSPKAKVLIDKIKTKQL